MLQLILTTLLSLGFNVNSGNHFTMNSRNAQLIQSSIEYRIVGGDTEFKKFISIDDVILDDIIIVDDDNPTN